MEWIKNLFGWSRTFGASRSPRWRETRSAFIAQNPCCEVCGTKGSFLKPNEVHHCIPFFIDKTQELQEDNLITLCRPHHYLFGHLEKWASYNVNVRKDAAEWRLKIVSRP